jgi:hypothetical protein
MMDDLEWIDEITVTKDVTVENVYEGMRVTLKETSEYKSQSNGPGTVIDPDYHDFLFKGWEGESSNTYVWVQWNHRDNGDIYFYQIGYDVYDLEFII